MRWCRLSACVCLVLAAGCAGDVPLLAQASPAQQSAPAVQLQTPREEPPPAAPTDKPPPAEAPAKKQPPSPDVPPKNEPGSPAPSPPIVNASPPPGRVAVRICATVNDVPILDSEVFQTIGPYMTQLQSMPEPQRSVELQKAFRTELDKLIDREILIFDAQARLQKNPQAERKLKEAAAKEFDKQLRQWKENLNRQPELGLKIESDDDLKPILARQGLSLDALKRKSEREFIAREYMMNRVWSAVDKIGHHEVRQYYDEHPGQFQVEDRVKWLHIFISSHNPEHPDPASARRLAEEVIRRLQAGEDFVQLAERYDNGFSKFSHGEGTGQRRGEIRPVEAEAYLFRMHEGDIGPVVETHTGCHVLKLVSREYAGLMPFDEATQVMAKKKLQEMVIQRESRRFVDELRRKATVKYFDNNQ